ncbi:hypothetical protein N7466_009398 [Penicillium verhagenii]|uniref:uncharacterized protein n=1 Tax=Penicillium verhagenii TaxID=1562060 RepID=UPI0025454D6A|nr:uncharacterized protein N7466_009398 [Penicillium verhagenii]KAJ5921072.1 hypothetical protein N7466_009398 [Penicillium verhagenii]
MTTGSCFCGNVKYEFSGEPAAKSICHCLSCRKITGSTYTTNFIIPETNFSKISGILRKCTAKHENGMDLTVNFCENCGTTIFKTASAKDFAGVIILAAGTVDQGQGVEKAKPERELWVKYRGNWLPPLEGAIQNQEFP